MAEQIIDGMGRGYRWGIDETHRGLVDATTQTEETYVCENDELAFTFSTGVATLSNTNMHLLMYIKNLNPDKSLRVWIANFGWNGGNTTHDRVMKWTWIVKLNEPTANFLSIPAGNLNFRSGKTAQALTYRWNGVGQGMTYTGGLPATEELFDKGHSIIRAFGIPILGLGDSFGVGITGEEVGQAVVSVRFYFK